MPAFEGFRLGGYAKGKTHNAVSVNGSGGTSLADLDTAGYSQLILVGRMTAALAADLAVAVLPYEDDGSTVFGASMPQDISTSPSFSGGVAYVIIPVSLRGIDKVRIRVTNGNAGAQTATVSYFLKR